MNVREASEIALAPSGSFDFQTLVQAHRLLRGSGMKNLARGIQIKLEKYLVLLERVPTHTIPLPHLELARDFAREIGLIWTSVTLGLRIKSDPRTRVVAAAAEQG